ncbi:MAG: type II toxin-antitoxin system VapC family toxin [Actinomycetes bacterium]
MTVYLDSSAAVKLLASEPESLTLAGWLDDLDGAESLVSSTLLETEMRRFAMRTGISQPSVSELLAQVSLVDPDRALFREAGLLPAVGLRSLDALHLATALRVDADLLVAYDHGLLQGAAGLGLVCASPD